MEHCYPETVVSHSLAFFNLANEHFQASLAHVEEIELFYQIADFTLRLKFSGNALVSPLTRALKHLEIAAVDHWDLTICIWDSVSTKTSPIKYPWSVHNYEVRGEVMGYNSDRIYTVVDIHTGVLHLFDKESHLALYWIKDVQDLPWWIEGSPLQLLLHWWMRTQGYQLTHAAAVGYPHGGVLLTGKSGSGKSTTSLACMKAGMSYVSEDYCFISDLPEIWAHSVYNSAKVEEKSLHWFPELRNHIANRSRKKEEKAFLFHHQFQPEKILLGCPLKALITLKIEGSQDSWLEPIDTSQAVTSLSISTMWQLTHTGPVVFKHLKRISEALPCYRLHLGSDLMQAPKLVAELL